MSVYNAIKYDPINAGSLTLISTFTSDGSDATATFASGIDSTYKEYLFIINNIHPETDAQKLTVGFRDGSTAYDATKTTTYFGSYHYEGGTDAALGYSASNDIAQGTGFVLLTSSVGNDNDQCCSGYLRLFNPSSTTFVKHFISNISDASHDDANDSTFAAGYCNVTAAIDGVQFKFASGEIQGGTIGLFGVK